jgi:hypothetical protein
MQCKIEAESSPEAINKLKEKIIIEILKLKEKKLLDPEDEV